MRNIFKTFISIYSLFDQKSKKSFIVLLIFVFLMCVLDLIGIGLMVPVISLASGKGDYNTYLQDLNISMSTLLILVVLVFLCKNFYTTFVLRQLGKFAFGQVA